MKTAVLLLCLLPICLGIDCPNPPDVPVMDARTSKYTAALLFQGPGHEYPFQSCNGPQLTYVDGDRVSSEGWWDFYEVGSMIVKAGCTFIGFYDVNFSGASTQLRGPAVIPQSPGFDYMVGQDRVVKGFRSWYSQCGITYINCQPEDRFEVIFSCDNIGGQLDLDCTYTKTIGTSYSNEISDSMSIDTSIEVSLSASFWGLFESTLTTSVTTGYNWGSVSSETMSSQETFEVAATAGAGTTVLFEQATGFCDGSTVKTEMFRVTTQSKDGQILKTEILKSGKDGKWLPNEK